MKLFIVLSLLATQLVYANPTAIQAVKVEGSRTFTIPVFGGGFPVNRAIVKSCKFINLDNGNGTSDFAVMTRYRDSLGFSDTDKNFHFAEIPSMLEISKTGIVLKSNLMKMLKTMKSNSIKQIYTDNVGTDRETVVELSKETKVSAEFSNSLTFFRYTEDESALLRDYKYITFFFNKDFSKVNFLRINQGNWGVDCHF